MTLNDYLNNRQSIKLETNQYAIANFTDLIHPISFVWDFSKQELNIVNFVVPLESSLQTVNNPSYLVLNYKTSKYERVFKLSVDETKRKVLLTELISPELSPKGFRIKDNQ